MTFSSFSSKILLGWAMALLATLLLSVPSSVKACSCSRPLTVESSFAGVDTVLKVKIKKVKKNKKKKNQVFALKEYIGIVRDAYKYDAGERLGVEHPEDVCNAMPAPRERIIVRTANDEAMCGIALQVGETYALFGTTTTEINPKNGKAITYLDINLCSVQTPWRQLSARDKRNLNRQRNCRCQTEQCGPLPEAAADGALCPDGITTAGLPKACAYDAAANTCAWEALDNCPTCNANWQCNNQGEYCTAGYCTAAGSCRTVSDCINPFNQYATIECGNGNVGRPVCEQGVCGLQCDAIDASDPKQVDCPVDPCRVTRCDEMREAECVVDYHTATGSCRPLFYAPNGDLVCQHLSRQEP